jgi:hypothetical protein
MADTMQTGDATQNKTPVHNKDGQLIGNSARETADARRAIDAREVPDGRCYKKIETNPTRTADAAGTTNEIRTIDAMKRAIQ